MRTTCERRRSAETRFGQETASALFAVLSDLRAAPDFQAVLNLHAPTYNQADGLIGIGFAPGQELVMRIAHAQTPMTEHGDVAWHDVTRVQMLEVKVS